MNTQEVEAAIKSMDKTLRECAQPRIDEVKAYARTRYEDGYGWDYVIETMSDDDIYEITKQAHTDMGAKRAMSRHLKLTTREF